MEALALIADIARALRRIPNTAHAEFIQVIADILSMHTRTQGAAARLLEWPRLVLPKLLWMAPAREDSTRQRACTESMSEAREPRLIQHNIHLFYCGAMGGAHPDVLQSQANHIPI